MSGPAATSRRRDRLASYERTLTAIMVGSAVRAARKRIGMSQAELARRAGTSQPSIARLEQGRVSPTVISLERIARALKSELVVDFEPLSVPSGHQPSERQTHRPKRAFRSGASVMDSDPESTKRRTGSKKQILET